MGSKLAMPSEMKADDMRVMTRNVAGMTVRIALPEKAH